VKVTVAIEHKLSSLLGLKLRPGSGRPLERALQRVREELGFAPEEVALRLEREPWLVKRLAAALTVDETFFLRHPEHFEALTTHVRERLCSEDRRLVLWSAGCAGGEEPYSMAIAIHRALGEPALSRTQVLASDISEAALGRAKRGLYGPWSFRGVCHLTRTTYFECSGRGDEYRLRCPVPAAVTFQHNALEEQLCELTPKSIDVVFFRNVAIYLTDDALRRIYAGLFRVLRDDGILVLSPADPRPSSDRFSASHIGDVLVYRKSTTRCAATSAVIHAMSATRSEKRSDPFPRSQRGPGYDAHDAHDAADRSLATRAQQLADCGLLGEALSVLDTRLELGPRSAELLALRGRVQLAFGHAEASERDLRAALVMRPDQPLVRFHHALALESLQQRGACSRELRQLLTTLETRNESEGLDESTSVKSLRQAAQELLRRME